jgi:hypothetical protein
MGKVEDMGVTNQGKKRQETKTLEEQRKV